MAAGMQSLAGQAAHDTHLGCAVADGLHFMVLTWVWMGHTEPAESFGLQ